MDNAEGHGTVKAIEEYTKILRDDFDIKIVHQCPRSPETNTLDLGIWCTLQWAVDRLMRGKRGDMEALNTGVNAVWDDGNMEIAFNGVWSRLQRVLNLIIKEEGGNETVEKSRGKKGADMDVPFEWTQTSDTANPFAAVAARMDAAAVDDEAAILDVADDYDDRNVITVDDDDDEDEIIEIDDDEDDDF